MVRDIENGMEEKISLQKGSNVAQESVLVLGPGRIEKNYWADLWRYRELFLILAWTRIK